MISRADAARALALATLGALFVDVEPALAPAIGYGFGLDTASLGAILGLESLAAIAGGAAALALVKATGYRTLTVAALLLYVASNAATASASSAPIVAVLRAAAGLSEGVMLALAFAALSRTNDTHRLFAWFGITQTLSAVVAFPIVTWLLAAYGWRAPFVAIAVAGAVVLFAAIPSVEAMPVAERFVWRDVQPAGLVSIFLFFTAQCAVWPFLERLGANRGVSDALLGGALSIGALCGLAGSAVIASLPRRLSGWGACIGAGGINIAAILTLAFAPSPAVFIVGLGAFNFAWAAFAPLQLHALKRLGASTATFALASTATSAGFAVGPLLGGVLLHQSGEAAALAAGIAGTPLALAILVPLQYNMKRLVAPP